MGWNQGFEIFEATVMGAYKLGVLDKKLLAVLARPYRDTDIDSGGRRGIRVNGLEVEEVVIVVALGKEKLPNAPRLPRDFMKWTDEQSRLADEHYEEVQRLFRSVVKW